MIRLAKIIVYPIKSLDGIAVEKATLLSGGALEYDRQFAIFNEKGQFIQGKRNPKVHLLRATFDLNAKTVALGVEGKTGKEAFLLKAENRDLEHWLSDYFGETVFLRANTMMGFPDDTEASGPTVISTATLETVASWFPEIEIQEMRDRLRANLEIDHVPAFWEDRLFADSDSVVEFQIGTVTLQGINPCQRCVVPTRDSRFGKVYPNFQKTFITKRQETLPSWVNSSRFNHYYRLSVNTKIPDSESGKTLAVGDEVKILGVMVK